MWWAERIVLELTGGGGVLDEGQQEFKVRSHVGMLFLTPFDDKEQRLTDDH